MNLVFLDVDGVLNDSTTKERCINCRGISTKLLENLFSLVSKTNSKIVLISSWKQWWFKDAELKKNQDELAIYLDERFASMNMSIYDKIDECFMQRGKGIKRYIEKVAKKEHEVNFIILDDCEFDYKEENLLGHLIETSFYEGGLNDEKTNKAIDLMLDQIIKCLL